MQKEEDNKISFFNNQAEKIPSKSKIKVGAFLAIGATMALDLIVNVGGRIINFSVNHKLMTAALVIGALIVPPMIENSKQNSLIEKQQISLMKSNIKAIPEQDFKNFISYLKYQQNSYDSRVEILNKYIVEVGIANGNPAKAFSNEKTLNLITSYKQEYEKIISSNINVYNNIKNNLLVNRDDIKKFNLYYNKFKSNLLISNSSIEERLNDLSYMDSQTIKYYKEHNVYTELENAKKEVEAGVEKIVVKP